MTRAWLLLYFFSPILTSLRGLQQASTLEQLQRKLGRPRGSEVFVRELEHRLRRQAARKEAEKPATGINCIPQTAGAYC